MRFVKLAVSATVAMTLAIALAGPAAAYQVISEVGAHGHYDITDTSGTPGAKCNYGPIVYSNWAFVVSMKVYAPHVFAADRDSGKRDSRVVSWQWKLQQKRFDATKWNTVKSSAIQRKTAYEDAMAPFTAMTINYNSEKDDMDHNGPSVIMRALVIIKWFKPNGDVESTVKLVPTYYAINAYQPSEPDKNGYCERVFTNG